MIAGTAEADIEAVKARGIGELTARLDTLAIDLQGIVVDREPGVPTSPTSISSWP